MFGLVELGWCLQSLCCWVGGGGGVESEFSDRFGYSLVLAKPNNKLLESSVGIDLFSNPICP